MADYKFFSPGTIWYAPTGGCKVLLSHEEVESITLHGTPVSAFALFLPPPFNLLLSAFISLNSWRLKAADKKHGYNGVVIVMGIGIGLTLLEGTDKW